MLVYLQLLQSEEEKTKFEHLYLTYRALMFSVARKILPETADAEDAVHQAFLYLIENLHKIHTLDCPETKAYVAIITENKAIDILRSRKHFYPGAFDEAITGVEIALPESGALSCALAKLSAKYRNVILLRFAYGYTTKELAGMYGCSVDAAQKLVWRSKLALKEQLEKDGVVV